MTESTILTREQVEQLEPMLATLSLVPKDLAQKTQTIAFQQENKQLSLLTTNNFPQLFHQVLDKLQAQGYTCTTYFTDSDSFGHAMTWFQRLEKQQAQQAEKDAYKAQATGAEAIALIKQAYEHITNYSEGDFINEIIRLSYQAGASDIHFQTEEMGVVMRLRIDGVLQTVIVFEHAQFKKYLMKFKYISGVKMNVDDKSQDGRFDFDIQKDDQLIKIDIRVSIMPGLRGESLTLRFLDATKGIMDFPALGLENFHITELKQQLQKHYGLILVTGPTGSGKTTTVYSILNYINHPSTKIITLEDPVEYELPGIEQVQINEKEGFGFEAGLKGVLRHDPDIIMVGEIRTLKSAEMAVNAALTGHLVISTIHTNSAVEAVTRMLNMGVKPFMLASALNMIIGQRLLRKVKTPEQTAAPEQETSYIQTLIEKLKGTNIDNMPTFAGTVTQAQKHNDTINDGYKGRIAAYELLTVTPAIKEAILHHKSGAEILDLALSEGFLTMRDNAYLKMLQGVTTLEEIERVLS